MVRFETGAGLFSSLRRPSDQMLDAFVEIRHGEGPISRIDEKRALLRKRVFGDTKNGRGVTIGFRVYAFQTTVGLRISYFRVLCTIKIIVPTRKD